jgi:hypothetical protein
MAQMIQDTGTALYGAAMSSAGIVAQISLPGVPDDLKTWPVTAILGLLLMSCLSLIAFQVYAAGKASAKAQEAAMKASEASIENAKAMTQLFNRQDTVAGAMDRQTVATTALTSKVTTLVTIMEHRPCVGGAV